MAVPTTLYIFYYNLRKATMSSTSIYSILCSKPHNLHYLNRYWKFIQLFFHQNQVKHNTSYHHICPKSSDLFPEYASLKLNPWNGVHLTYRQHYIAHWLLSKAYGGKQKYAFIMLCRIGIATNKIRISSLTYEKISTQHSLNITGPSNPFYNKKHTVETINKLKQYNGPAHHAYGSSLSEEKKAKTGTGNAKVWFTITPPDGNTVSIRNLSKYCREHSLHPAAMINVAKNKQHSHKGYICKYAN